MVKGCTLLGDIIERGLDWKGTYFINDRSNIEFIVNDFVMSVPLKSRSYVLHLSPLL